MWSQTAIASGSHCYWDVTLPTIAMGDTGPSFYNNIGDMPNALVSTGGPEFLGR